MNSAKISSNNTSITNGLVIVLLLIMALQAILSMRQKSVTVDEITYIATGYYHLKTGDFQMNMTNPPLMKVVSALPLLILNPDLPQTSSNPRDWSAIQEWQYAREFMYGNTTDADAILFTARLSIVAVSILLGIYLFRWATALYGSKAGLLALFLFSFSPNILAHTRFATQDLGLTCFMFMATYYFWRYMNQPNWRLLLLCGLFTGIAIVTKSTAFLLPPIFAAYGFVLSLKRDFLVTHDKLPFVGRISATRPFWRKFWGLVVTLVIIGLTVGVVVNVAYGFQGSFTALDQEMAQKINGRLPANNTVQSLASTLFSLPLPLPSPYIQSLIFQFGLASGAGHVYFAGNYYDSGLWYLMPVSFLLKTPIPTLVLLLTTMLLLFIRRQKLNTEWLIAIFVTAVLLFFMFLANLNVGVRYILPIYPFIFLLISRLASLEFKQTQLVRGSAVVLGLWYIVGTLFIYPHYLSYFNEVIGGPNNGYKYLVESNVDWGQDLKELKLYMDEHDLDSIKLGYFGSADANYYGINYEYLPSVGLAPQQPDQYWWYEIDSEEKKRLEPQTGMVAISVNILTSPGWMHPLFYSSYDWLRQHEPVDRVGYSIFIYDISEPASQAATDVLEGK